MKCRGSPVLIARQPDTLKAWSQQGFEWSPCVTIAKEQKTTARREVPGFRSIHLQTENHEIQVSTSIETVLWSQRGPEASFSEVWSRRPSAIATEFHFTLMSLCAKNDKWAHLSIDHATWCMWTRFWHHFHCDSSSRSWCGSLGNCHGYCSCNYLHSQKVSTKIISLALNIQPVGWNST